MTTNRPIREDTARIGDWKWRKAGKPGMKSCGKGSLERRETERETEKRIAVSGHEFGE